MSAQDPRGLRDDSVIIFLSDHGDGVAARLESGGTCGEVVNVADQSNRPKGTGLRGCLADEAVSGLDLYVTVCDYAGVVRDRTLPRTGLRYVAGARQARSYTVASFSSNAALGRR